MIKFVNNKFIFVVMWCLMCSCHSDKNTTSTFSSILGIWIPRDIKWRENNMNNMKFSSFKVIYFHRVNEVTFVETNIYIDNEDSLSLEDAFFLKVGHGFWERKNDGNIIIKYRMTFSDIVLPSEKIPSDYKTVTFSSLDILSDEWIKTQYVKTTMFDSRSRNNLDVWNKLSNKSNVFPESQK